MQEITDQAQVSNNIFLKTKETSEERRNRLISEHKGKIANSYEELLGQKTKQTQEEIQAEVDDFLRLREEWRKECRERDYDR